MSITKREVRQFLTAIGRALSIGDVDRVAAAWHVPAVVVDVRGSLAVTHLRQVRSFFKRAVADYHGRGIAAPMVESLDVVKVSDSMVTAAVGWRQLLVGGGKGALERSFYVISRRDGALGIDLASSRDKQ